MADGKSIQVIPDSDVYESVTELSEKLRTSRAGFCALALEFIIPRIESGELVSLNGKLVPASAAQA